MPAPSPKKSEAVLNCRRSSRGPDKQSKRFSTTAVSGLSNCSGSVFRASCPLPSNYAMEFGLRPLVSPPRKRRKHHTHHDKLTSCCHGSNEADVDDLTAPQGTCRYDDSGHRQKTELRTSSHRHSHTKRKNYFNLLPDEMVLKICSYLPRQSLARVAQTCKRFACLVEDEVLWERIDAASATIISDTHLKVIIRRRPVFLRLARCSFKDIQLTCESSTNSLPLPPSPANPPFPLRYLDLSMACMDPIALASFLSLFPFLEKLSLEHLSVSSVVLESISEPQRLVELNMAMAEEVDLKSLGTFLRQATSLVSLNLSCLKPSHENRINWTHGVLLELLESLSASLRFLNVSGFRHILCDEHVEKLCASHENLFIELDLSDAQNLTTRSVRAVITYMTDSIQSLGFSRCYGIDPSSYLSLSACKNLRSLAIYSILKEASLAQLRRTINNTTKEEKREPPVALNESPFSRVARPTTGNKRSSIWGVRLNETLGSITRHASIQKQRLQYSVQQHAK